MLHAVGECSVWGGACVGTQTFGLALRIWFRYQYGGQPNNPLHIKLEEWIEFPDYQVPDNRGPTVFISIFSNNQFWIFLKILVKLTFHFNIFTQFWTFFENYSYTLLKISRVPIHSTVRTDSLLYLRIDTRSVNIPRFVLLVCLMATVTSMKMKNVNLK